MEDALVTVASALNVYERKLDAAALNISHARMPGYVPRIVGAKSFSASLNAANNPRLSTQDSLDLGPGEVVNASDPLSAAIVGEGFYTVETPDGPAYTRGGDFEIVDGALATRGGYPVLGEGGRLRPTATGGPLTIADDGSVLQGATPLGKLKVVRFPAGTEFDAVSDALLAPRNGAAPTALSSVKLAPGMVEMPPVQTVQSLVEMIAIQRGFEGAQRASSVMHDAFERMLRSPT